VRRRPTPPPFPSSTLFRSTQGDRNVGFEILDRERGLGTSQFMETTQYRRGLEGELARTISSLYNVKAARVHIAMPRSTVFVRDRSEEHTSELQSRENLVCR